MSPTSTGAPAATRARPVTACASQSADGTLLDELHGALGIATNNVAEYNGLLAALQWAVDHERPSVHIRADSELLVKQMRGEYKVKNPGCSRSTSARACSSRSSTT